MRGRLLLIVQKPFISNDAGYLHYKLNVYLKSSHRFRMLKLNRARNSLCYCCFMCNSRFCYGCKSRFSSWCCCMNRQGNLACPGHLMFKKKCLFLVIVASILFSALFAISSTFYLSLVESEWVFAQCHVSKSDWRSDLYDIYLSNVTNPIFVTNGTIDINNTYITNDTLPSKPTKLQVKGWLYYVNVKYKNMYFSSVIRDPSETEMIPPIYETNQVYECLCMVEKLRSEIAFQKETYEKYLTYMKQQREKEGKSISDYVHGVYDDDENDIFFVVATMWPKIDTFSYNHEMEKTVKITLVASSFLMLFVGIIMLKIFYSHYVTDGEPDYAHVSRI